MEKSITTEEHASGKLFRESIEDTFDKVCSMIANRQIEVVMPQEGEFLVGDNPAITIRNEGGSITYGVAVGDSDTVVLPVGPRHMLALAPQNLIFSVPKTTVDKLNALQIRAAYRHVFFRPGSSLETFARMTSQLRTLTGS
jgi:hypothetical protein